MSLMRPYESVDIETTGLDRMLSEVLEIGLVADLGVGYGIEKLPKANIILDNPGGGYYEPYAANMNARLFALQCDPSVQKSSPKEAFAQLLDFTRNTAKLSLEWDNNNPNVQWKTEKVQIAGKNASVFDVPVLINYFTRKGIPADHIKEWSKYYMHRFMDVGGFYANQFGYVPDMNQINQITGRGAVRHQAMEDAIDNVFAARLYFGVNPDGSIIQR